MAGFAAWELPLLHDPHLGLSMERMSLGSPAGDRGAEGRSIGALFWEWQARGPMAALCVRLSSFGLHLRSKQP